MAIRKSFLCEIWGHNIFCGTSEHLFFIFITLQKFSPTKVSRYNIMVCVVDNTVAVYIFTVSLTNICGVYSINNALKDTIPEITFEWK